MVNHHRGVLKHHPRRQMLDPSYFMNTKDMLSLQDLMSETFPEMKPDLAIANWCITQRTDGALGMTGLLSGQPEFEDVRICAEPVWQFSSRHRIVRTSHRWIALDRGYHEDVPADIEIEAIGPEGCFIAPCVAERYLEIILGILGRELR